jgi:hypothetical protein
MVIESFYKQAAAEYQCNVREFISTGEGREFNTAGKYAYQDKIP